MRRRAVAGLALVLAGCGADTSVPVSGPVAVYEPTGEGGDSARFDGVLEMTDGCVTVRSPEDRVVPVFPDEAVWSAGELSFRGHTYVPGDRVALGGGHSDGFGDSATAYVPAACDPATPVWIVHQETKSLDPF